MIYPWQQKAWQQLGQAFSRGKLPNALLFSGVSGIGKSLFALTFARSIICRKRITQDTLCDAPDFCHDCHLINTNLHPAVYQIAAEKGHVIKVDQIREMISYIANTPFKSKYQCVIINTAEDLNEFAANALLKTLEEPAANIFILLTSNEKSRLLKTILSRTLQINLRLPSQEVALSWLAQQISKPNKDLSLALQVARGAPLKALALLQSDYLTLRQLVYNALENIVSSPSSLVSIAATLQNSDEEVVNELLLSFVSDLAKIKVNADSQCINNVDHITTLQTFANKRTLQEITATLFQLNQIYHSLKRGTHLNKTLSLEYMLMMTTRGKEYVFS